MIRFAYIIVVVVLTIELVSGDPKKYEGFTYLGPVPSGSTKSTRAQSYYLSDEPASWNNAYTACSNLLGILASPINPVLDNALRTYMVQNSATDVPIWLGATREIDANWVWITKMNLNVQWSNFFPTGCTTMNVKGALAAMYTTNNGWGWCGQSYSRATNRYVCEF